MLQTLPITPIISVIVATRNRRASLARFIQAIRSLPKNPAWELIVVDNGSADGTDGLLSDAAKSLPIIIVTENVPGKSKALNKALEYALGEILLFTDDDVIPDPNWLVALHKAALDFPQANVFGGRILVDRDQIPGWIVNSYNLRAILTSEQDLGGDVCWFAKDQYPLGPNLALRRRSLNHGTFFWPVDFGPGTKIPVGDERAFLMQVSHPESSDRLYVPDSVVRHETGYNRFNITKALVRCFLGGYAAGLIHRSQDQSSLNQDASVLRVAWRRFRVSSSVRELACMLARALGVMAGTLRPLSRPICG